jgi:hypothetical protein
LIQRISTMMESAGALEAAAGGTSTISAPQRRLKNVTRTVECKLRDLLQPWIAQRSNIETLSEFLSTGVAPEPGAAVKPLFHYNAAEGVLRVAPLTVLQLACGGDFSTLELPSKIGPNGVGRGLKAVFGGAELDVQCRGALGAAVRLGLPESFCGPVSSRATGRVDSALVQVQQVDHEAPSTVWTLAATKVQEYADTNADIGLPWCTQAVSAGSKHVEVFMRLRVSADWAKRPDELQSALQAALGVGEGEQEVPADEQAAAEELASPQVSRTARRSGNETQCVRGIAGAATACLV